MKQTELEGLWMGVPAVALNGESFAARHRASHLVAVGLDDGAVDTEAAYAARAIAAARDPTALADLRLRLRLRARVDAVALRDSAGFAAALGAELRALAMRASCTTSP